MDHVRESSGPRGRFFVGHLRSFGSDPLGFLERCAREHGDFVRLRFFHRSVCLINHPELIELVLVTFSKKFRKTLGYRTPFMRRLFGQGLLTSEGDHWLRQRRLAQPAFHRDRIAAYARDIVEFTNRMLDRWNPEETREIHADVMRLTTEVATKCLFNSSVPKEIDRLSEASVAVMKRFTMQWSAWRMFLNLLPTRSAREFEEVMKQLDDFIFGLIRERRTSGEDNGDLLSMLLLARDEDGSRMTDQQLRDELTTLMVAGLDTTALALSWAIYLLTQNPEEQFALQAELDQILQDRAPGFEDFHRLRFAESVIKESMRLYPPGWILGREALEDCELNGPRIARGTSVIMSPWLMHRDARWFREPERFQPSRWLEEGVKQLPKFAYFPFGGGPRTCIGNSFAMMEATLALATSAQRFTFKSGGGQSPRPWPAITLQPAGGIWVTLEHRSRLDGDLRRQPKAHCVNMRA